MRVFHCAKCLTIQWRIHRGGGGGGGGGQTRPEGVDPALLSLFMVTRLKLLSWFLHAAFSQGIK